MLMGSVTCASPSRQNATITLQLAAALSGHETRDDLFAPVAARCFGVDVAAVLRDVDGHGPAADQCRRQHTGQCESHGRPPRPAARHDSAGALRSTAVCGGRRGEGAGCSVRAGTGSSSTGDGSGEFAAPPALAQARLQCPLSRWGRRHGQTTMLRVGGLCIDRKQVPVD
jgi:hypothetical protein